MKNINNKQKKAIIITTIVVVLIALITIITKKIVDEVNRTIQETAALAASEAYEEATVSTIASDQELEVQNLMKEGFLPLDVCMSLAGYTKTNGDSFEYETTISHIPVTVYFDFDNNICSKNEYRFDLIDVSYNLRDVTYIRKDCLSSIINYEFKVSESGEITCSKTTDSYNYDSHEWTDGQLIAHAGGGYRDTENGFYSYYTNSSEALVQNYNLGARVFEFDFSLTSDNRLAAVHDWNDFGNMNGEPLSSEEWENASTVAKPLTDGTYTTMLVEDILDQMMVNQDMYLVTDVKYDNTSQEEIEQEFSTIVTAANERDPDLIKRIVPQIYNEEMYDWVMSVYNFPSIIFTCYKTDASADEIITFCSSKDNIHVITAKYEDKRFDEEAVISLHESGLLFYNYTVSTFTKMYDGLANGVDGIYSNTLLPQDFEVYYKSK